MPAAEDNLMLVRSLIHNFSGFPLEQIDLQSNMSNVPGWDSLTHVEICTHVAHLSGKAIDEDFIERCSSARGIHNILSGS